MNKTKKTMFVLFALVLMSSFTFADQTIKSLKPNGQEPTQNRDCTSCEFDWTDYGSECCDSAWDEYAIDCATLEANYGWDCAGCLCPGDLPPECGDGSCNGDETFETCPEDCDESGCGAGEVADCDESGECWTEGWIGDGFCDGTAQQYGADLCCYDNDGGDCTPEECAPIESCEDQGLITCDDGTCADSFDDCPEEEDTCADGYCPDGTYWDGFTCYDCSYCVDTSDDSACASETGNDCCGACGGSADFACTNCEDNGQITCWDGSCADSFDDCPEEPTIGDPVDVCIVGSMFDPGDGTGEAPAVTLTWTDPNAFCGDGVCNGDEDETTCPDDCASSEACADCEFDWSNYGSECCDTAWDEFGIDCATLESNYGWDCAGCSCPGDAAATCGDGLCNGDETNGTCPDDCTVNDCNTSNEVDDCADEDCCPVSWIGDGYGDCVDQEWGCDLTCYDNDGGDCDTREYNKPRPIISSYMPESSHYLGSDENNESSSRDRALFASLDFVILEGYNAGLELNFTTVAEEFTVYGFDPTDYVCVTVSYCDDTNGACSDGVGPVCAYAGDDSSTECADGGGGPDIVLGDVNFDTEINVLDIVIIVNHILGTDLLSGDAALAADYNEDGEVNVLDIVQMVNVILGAGRADNASDKDVELVMNTDYLYIDQAGVAGLQLEVSGNFSNISSKAYDLYYNDGTVLVISLDGKDIAGKVFDFDGDITINDMIVSNWNGSEVTATVVVEPGAFNLHPAYPNPFNPVTNIAYDVTNSALVNISVYDVLGRNMETLVNEVKPAGAYSINWNAASYSSGVYYVKMVSGESSQMQKVVLMK